MGRGRPSMVRVISSFSGFPLTHCASRLIRWRNTIGLGIIILVSQRLRDVPIFLLINFPFRPRTVSIYFTYP